MKVTSELKEKGFWPTEQELCDVNVAQFVSSKAELSIDDEILGVFASMIKLSETNLRNNQLEARAYAYLYQLVGADQFDEFYYAFSKALTSLFHRQPIGYDTFIQKVQAGMLLLKFPNLAAVRDLTMLQILYRFHEKHPDIAESICTSGVINGDPQIVLFSLSGAAGRKQLREGLRDLLPTKKKPAEDKRKMLERLIGEHIDSLSAVEQDIRGYGLDPTLGEALSGVVKQLFHLKDQVSAIRQQLKNETRQEIQRICKVA